ncbi:MAG TPA: Gfo/Idh/MocA family oxidoreductase [Candidatus Methylomirabilis sp.]|nr:Gfo/Idh/MocA family oxidoreductase [Candidatus Methylomirabilis sp.]
MRQISVGIIGTGWCGGIRAQTCAAHPLVRELHIAEVRAERLAEVAKASGARTATTDYRELLRIPGIDLFYLSMTPENLHYPMARECLLAGKHVFLEKPMAVELSEADELIEIARRGNRKFSIGYSQRFNPKFAYVKKAIAEGTIGRPVSALVSRHITRGLGKKISGRTRLSPAAMEATHDLDFVLWCLAPARPVRVYSQVNYGAMREATGGDVPDTQYITVSLDTGASFVVGAGWSLPPGYPNFSTTWIEMIGTEGALLVDDSHRDVVLNTMQQGMRLPMSSMPGEFVDHAYAGPMRAETIHFLEAVALDRPVLVTPEEARQVMEVYLAADLSAERNQAVSLPVPALLPASVPAGGAR